MATTPAGHMDLTYGNWWAGLLTVSFIFLFALVLSRRSRLVSVVPILLAVVCTYVVLILSEAGPITEGNRALGQEWTTNLARSIFGSGIAVVAILGLFLDNVNPGDDAERGIIGGGGPLLDPKAPPPAKAE